MITPVTLTADEFKELHNALCELDRSLDPNVQSIVERLRSEVLKNAYAQEDAVFQKRMTHYNDVRDSLGFETTWSIYEVEDLSHDHPYVGATKLIYRDHWGKKTVEAPIKSGSWTSLYEAANAVIRASGDDHHVFIEDFNPVPDQPGVLALVTGS